MTNSKNWFSEIRKKSKKNAIIALRAKYEK